MIEDDFDQLRHMANLVETRRFEGVEVEEGVGGMQLILASGVKRVDRSSKVATHSISATSLATR